jgi:broad-specificity NMP kinase
LAEEQKLYRLEYAEAHLEMIGTTDLPNLIRRYEYIEIALKEASSQEVLGTVQEILNDLKKHRTSIHRSVEKLKSAIRSIKGRNQ